MQEVRDYIVKAHGPEFLPDEPRYYKTAKMTQGAHEAIRPTSMELTPNLVQEVCPEATMFLLLQPDLETVRSPRR